MKTISNFFGSPKINKSILILGFGLIALSCSDDDDAPVAVDEEEVITTMTITLTGSGNTITLQSQDLDGDGPNNPEITVSDNLLANTTYSGSIELLNEAESPAEDITEEIEEEDEEHQFFFTTGGAISGVTYSDEDSDGNPVGLSFELTTGDAGEGTLLVTLRHEPTKPNDGSLADAGGETDIAQSFDITVQ